MTVRALELLAPAKNLEIGLAALLAGADAVYIGGSGFGARAAAGNAMDDIASLCRQAHRLGARVYLTVNTLLYDNELAAVDEMLAAAAVAGVDALIVQDPAVLSLKHARGFELHGSTQMNIDTLDKVDFYTALGFDQIVLPREFSRVKIEEFCQARPQQRFEVFVSGAMCVSVSGVCYISEYMTGRSANRGECAQICRLPMTLCHHEPRSVYADSDEVVATGHLLSMKDNLRLSELDLLVAAGASSFKIEGRLKDHDYVVNQVAAFRQKLDAIIEREPERYRRASLGRSRYGFVPDVAKTFNRGFTRAYLDDDNTDLVDIRTPKSPGELLGTVVSCDRAPGRALPGGSVGVTIRVARDTVISNGDSFTFFNESGELTGFRCNRALAVPAQASGAGRQTARGQVKGKTAPAPGRSAGAGAVRAGAKAGGGAAATLSATADSGAGALMVKAGAQVTLLLNRSIAGLKPGTKLNRNVDTLFIKNINAPRAVVRQVPLSAEIRASAQGLTITFKDEYGRQGTAFQNWAADEGVPILRTEVMVSKLQKLGDELLSLDPDSITLLQPDLMGRLPLSAFNALRREALQHYREVTELTWQQCQERALPFLDGTRSRRCTGTDCSRLAGPVCAGGMSTLSGEQDATRAVIYPEQGIDRRLITNEYTAAFYQKYSDRPGHELPEQPSRLIAEAVMTCRNCLIKNHALCHKDGGRTTGYYVRIGGHIFDIVTDCRRCLMYLVPSRSTFGK